MAIDIGAEAIDRGASWSTYTQIGKDNPANATGTITTVYIWCAANLVGCKVGIFYKTNGDTLKCRSAVTIGAVAAGAMRTFGGLSLAVVAGDYIGMFYSSGGVELDTSGFAGLWYGALDVDHVIVDDETTYSFLANFAISLKGIGTEPQAIVKISAETVGLIESFLNRMRANRLITETISLADSAIRRAMASRIADEAINITETMFWVFLAIFTEIVGIADSLIRITGITKVFSEAIGIADGLVKRFWATRLMTESLSIVDSAVKRLWSVRLISEALGIADSKIRRQWSIRIKSEAIGILETFVKALPTELIKIIQETVGVADSVIKRAWSIRLMVEAVGIADDLVRRLRSVRVITETLSIVEGFVKHIVGLVNIFSSEIGIGKERASRAGWLMKPSVYTKEPFELKTYTGE